MRLAQHTIWIAQPREAVFDFFVDFTKAPLWRSYVRDMALVGAGPLRVGSVVHVTMDMFGQRQTFDLQVLAYERPLLWRHRTNETDFRGHIEYRFASEGSGTRVTMTLEAKPIGIYGWLAVPLLLLRRGKPYAEQLPRLKQVMEAHECAAP